MIVNSTLNGGIKMEGFLHISYKGHYNFLQDNTIKSTIDNYKNVKHTFRIHHKNNIIGVYYTNEYNNYPYNIYAENLFCPVGQFIEDKLDIQETLIKGTKSDRIKMVQKISGAFSLSHVDFKAGTIHLYTHVVRAESIYIYEDDYKIITGSDPLLVSALSNDSLKPEFDSSNFTAFFEQGYFADNSTPYKNVFCLPENSYIKINHTIKIESIDDTYDTAFTFKQSEELLSDITDQFINSFKIMPDQNASILSGLTGGKDSRVILLALLKQGYNVSTHTTGFDDHPDVIVARLLAQKLNVPHKVNKRTLNKENKLIINLEKRLIDITNASSGLLSAYDNVTTKNTFNNLNNFNGVAASVITGGFNKFTQKPSDNAGEALKRAVYKFHDYYIDKNNNYSKYLDNFSMKSSDYQTLLHLFFLINRTGRWTSDSRVPKGYATNSFSVFLDNQLTKSAMKLNMTDLRSEVIHYKLIEELNPKILNIPFANQRFAFEKDGPISPDDYDNWLQRAPIHSKNKVGTYNWRSLGNNDLQLTNAFKEVILSRRNNKVFDNVDYKKVEQLLNGKIQARTNKFIWAIASMIKFTDYIDNYNVQSQNKIKLNVPQESVIPLNIPSEVLDLTYDYHILNDSLTFDKDTFEIILNNNNGNPYLKSYKGGFNHIPKSRDISNVSNITFETVLTLEKNYSNIKFLVIFYTENKRFKTVIIKPNFKADNIVIFKENITVPKSAKYFRTVVHFSDKVPSHHKLNYSYAKLVY